jgi:hypothetical protein
MAGNICRCGTHTRIARAIKDAPSLAERSNHALRSLLAAELQRACRNASPRRRRRG